MNTTHENHPNLSHLESSPHDPFQVLGPHYQKDTVRIRVFSPNTIRVVLSDIQQAMTRIPDSDYFEWQGPSDNIPPHYRLSVEYDNHSKHSFVDPYSFDPVISDFDLHLFGEGNHWHIYEILGANPKTVDGISGIVFAVWAPNASRISVVGNFNHWDGRRHAMRNRGGSGVWEIFIPDIKSGDLYKFEIIDQNKQLHLKSDPYARAFELRPDTASIVQNKTEHQWQDQPWLTTRSQEHWRHKPLSVYELHLGSWQRDANHQFLNYREIAHQLVDYLTPLAFTHIELLPITEHPLDASWGYQTLGCFAPTSRFGNPDDFRYFVDYLHQHNIGVILDWVPAHFPMDSHGLARFDGTSLYEHADPRKGEHRDWGTYIYNYGRNEVKNFLIASALYWLTEFHVDGLRVDAVASMLYLDYSREANDWVPNEHGGNENLEAIEFIKHLTSVTQQLHQGSLLIAEESTAWPAVSGPTEHGGLGFSMKWNMGWMHDTLNYMTQDPVHRSYHHNNLTFGMMYAFSENFVLPFSHDEVVHGKGSLLGKMPGDEWQKFANLRLLYTYMFTYPGKKLLFMGNEIAQPDEWDHDGTLPWDILETAPHKGILKLVADLNQIYRNRSALYYYEFEEQGFSWIDCQDAAHSIISYQRKYQEKSLFIVLNFTPVPRENYRLGVPDAGQYNEIFNSDSGFYGGSNVGNDGIIHSENISWMNRPHSLALNLPPLGGLVLERINQ
ncbi:MAG TPA: 1,4-alpha-glucan branching protein GlgB [Gammaproteobacteria bacterium]|nr:1,4-alpha-glucan branching protein GlgB [Gammaproteobacteria bacterium]